MKYEVVEQFSINGKSYPVDAPVTAAELGPWFSHIFNSGCLRPVPVETPTSKPAKKEASL